MFDNNFQVLKNLLNSIGIRHNDNIFKNENYTNIFDSDFTLKDKKPNNKDHMNYRTWQINEPFICNNDYSKIDLTETQKQQIINDENILAIYPDISNNLF